MSGRPWGLNQTFMRKVRPEDKAFEVYAEFPRGLLLRVVPSGRKVFLLGGDPGECIVIGRASEMTSGEAREAATVLSRFGCDDTAEARRQARTLTLYDFLDAVYAPWVAKNCGLRPAGGTQCSWGVLDRKLVYEDDTIERIEAAWGPAFGETKLTEITAAKASAVSEDASLLKAALDRAAEWGYIDSNPLADHTNISQSGPVISVPNGKVDRQLVEDALEGLDNAKTVLKKLLESL